MKIILYLIFCLISIASGFIVCMEEIESEKKPKEYNPQSLLILTAIVLGKQTLGEFRSKDFSEGIEIYIKNAISKPWNFHNMHKIMNKLRKYKKLLIRAIGQVDLIRILCNQLNKYYCLDNNPKMSPLMVAAAENFLAVKIILDTVDDESKKEMLKARSLACVIPFIEGELDKTCFMLALDNSEGVEVLNLLLEVADSEMKQEMLCSKDRLGQNVLMLAAQKKNCCELIETILEKADEETKKKLVNDKNEYGKTALDYFIDNISKLPKNRQIAVNKIKFLLGSIN